MTQDEIIDLARQARLPYYYQDGAIVNLERLEAFAKLVDAKATAKEREACAMVCDELQAPPHVSDDDMSMWDVTSMECADAIRARGETTSRGEA